MAAKTQNKLNEAHLRLKEQGIERKLKRVTRKYRSQIQMDTIDYRHGEQDYQRPLSDDFYEDCVDLYFKTLYKTLARDHEKRLKNKVPRPTAEATLERSDVKFQPQIKVSHGKLFAQINVRLSSDPNSRYDNKTLFIKAGQDEINLGTKFSWGNLHLEAVKTDLPEFSMRDESYNFSATIYLDMRVRKASRW